MDPKVHLSNERTLLDWAAMAGMVAVVGLALQGSPKNHHQARPSAESTRLRSGRLSFLA